MSTSSAFEGYTFKDGTLLEAALRHSSISPTIKRLRIQESGRKSTKPAAGTEHFERLEFLGDRVVGLVVASMLMRDLPREAEGSLTRHHTALVRAETLADLARTVGLDERLRTAACDPAKGSSLSDNMLADALEAVFGAVYLDGGLSAAEPIIRRLWTPLLGNLEHNSDLRDAKTRLQEWAQARSLPLPVYAIVSHTGPAHAPAFEVSATVSGFKGGNPPSARGKGTSKRLAEQNAAAALLEILNNGNTQNT